jgi:hypothetical protein
LPKSSVHVAAPIVASAEYFSRFTSPICEDDRIVATTYGQSRLASQITHDVEFEKWAGACR